MAYVLQSQSDNTLYFNGSVTKSRGSRKPNTFAYFSPLSNARVFDDLEEATETAETEFEVPVNIVEV